MKITNRQKLIVMPIIITKQSKRMNRLIFDTKPDFQNVTNKCADIELCV